MIKDERRQVLDSLKSQGHIDEEVYNLLLTSSPLSHPVYGFDGQMSRLRKTGLGEEQSLRYITADLFLTGMSNIKDFDELYRRVKKLISET